MADLTEPRSYDRSFFTEYALADFIQSELELKYSSAEMPVKLIRPGGPRKTKEGAKRHRLRCSLVGCLFSGYFDERTDGTYMLRVVHPHDHSNITAPAIPKRRRMSRAAHIVTVDQVKKSGEDVAQTRNSSDVARADIYHIPTGRTFKHLVSKYVKEEIQPKTAPDHTFIPLLPRLTASPDDSLTGMKIRIPILASIMHSADDPTLGFLCKKMLEAKNRLDQCQWNVEGLFIAQCDGKLWLRGNNTTGQTGSGSTAVWQVGFQRIHIPRVESIVVSAGSVFVDTCRGVYAWGNNAHGKLGVNSTDPTIFTPRKVDLPSRCDVTVLSSQHSTLFSAPGNGIFIAGLAAPIQHRDDVPVSFIRPTYIPGTATAFKMWTDSESTAIFQTPQALMAYGHIDGGRLGISPDTTETHTMGTISVVSAPIPVPDGMTVETVVMTPDNVFILTDQCRCLVSGTNKHGQLGLQHARPINTPELLPFNVESVVSSEEASIFISSGKTMVVGDNTYHQLPIAVQSTLVPTEVQLPSGAPFRVFLAKRAMFLHRNDGRWVVRGDNARGRLGIHTNDLVATEWCEISMFNVHEILADGDDHIFVANDALYRIDGNIMTPVTESSSFDMIPAILQVDPVF
ncbi:Regulator of chromosome condensation (RCC1) repeat [Carpediemonas membranifera]|uniref:Regulator of chromosome condensation (RCC1) repeat n=1 Tax=Carpediemonas membranifera TaxID=201153 RepID=A0A8J6AWG3_9EUKA|nr:Regulator of chromosome condensation (RCC1) repeat [Carpediemonas membranifera]|eukprot:KAG9390003.1 Regulator of chromosome condensation (RCC1) repeat [Carpediemonas membranifera]